MTASTELRLVVGGTASLSRRIGESVDLLPYGTPVDEIEIELGLCHDRNIREEEGFFLQLGFAGVDAEKNPDGLYHATVNALLDLENVRLLRDYCNFMLENAVRIVGDPE